MNKLFWPLFCDDLQQAEQVLKQALTTDLSDKDSSELVQNLTYFGKFEEAQDLFLRSNTNVMNNHISRGALMRTRLYRNHHNPWLSLCQPQQKGWFLSTCKKFENINNHIYLRLGGGFGDILELLASLNAAPPELKNRTTAVLPIRTKNALYALIESSPKNFRAIWSNDAKISQKNPEDLDIPPAVFFALIANQKQTIPKPIPIQKKISANNQKPRILCCWKSKVDKDHILWAHLRSLRLSTIIRIYDQLCPIAEELDAEIIDITRYRESEQNELKIRYSGLVKLASQTIKSFKDTSNLIHGNTVVASIDTSLVHLSCWCGHKPLVLAHKWPDSRWINLSWREAVILEQKELFNWEEPIEQMLAKIKSSF